MQACIPKGLYSGAWCRLVLATTLRAVCAASPSIIYKYEIFSFNNEGFVSDSDDEMVPNDIANAKMSPRVRHAKRNGIGSA